MSHTSLYERLGGQQQIVEIVDAMYAKVLADPELAPFFENARMDRLRKMQTEFLAAALGGPVEYSGMSLASAHRGRDITRHHFTRFVQCLLDTLEERGVDSADVDAVAGQISTYVDDITGSTSIDG